MSTSKREGRVSLQDRKKKRLFCRLTRLISVLNKMYVVSLPILSSTKFHLLFVSRRHIFRHPQMCFSCQRINYKTMSYINNSSIVREPLKKKATIVRGKCSISSSVFPGNCGQYNQKMKIN